MQDPVKIYVRKYQHDKRTTDRLELLDHPLNRDVARRFRNAPVELRVSDRRAPMVVGGDA